MLHDATETGNVQGLTPEQLEQVNACINYVVDLKSTRANDGWTLHAEVKEKFLEVPDVNPGWGGHVDLLLIWFKDYPTSHNTQTRKYIVDVIDYKFGKGAVEDAENNLQGFAYFLGALHLYPVISDGTVHFIAPRRDEVTFAKFDTSQKDEFVTRIKTIHARRELAKKAVDSYATHARPSHNVCQYCAHKGYCGPLIKFALKTAAKYEPLDIDVDQIHPSKIVKDPQVWRSVLRATTVLDAWAKSVRKYALDLVLTQDFDIPGYDVVRTKGKRSIKNYLPAVSYLKDFGLTDQEILDLTSISYTELEKFVAGKAPTGKATAAKKKLSEEMDEQGLLEYSEPSVYLKAMK